MNEAYPVKDPISKVYKISESMTLLRLVRNFHQYLRAIQNKHRSNLSDLERLMYNKVNKVSVMMISTTAEMARPREKSHYIQVSVSSLKCGSILHVRRIDF